MHNNTPPRTGGYTAAAASRNAFRRPFRLPTGWRAPGMMREEGVQGHIDAASRHSSSFASTNEREVDGGYHSSFRHPSPFESLKQPASCGYYTLRTFGGRPTSHETSAPSSTGEKGAHASAAAMEAAPMAWARRYPREDAMCGMEYGRDGHSDRCYDTMHVQNGTHADKTNERMYPRRREQCSNLPILDQWGASLGAYDLRPSMATNKTSDSGAPTQDNEKPGAGTGLAQTFAGEEPGSGTATNAVIEAPPRSSGYDRMLAGARDGGVTARDVPSCRRKKLTPMFVPGKIAPLHRKVCEVSDCRVQPSYGLSGTSRPRFCSGHKLKGMVALKNRPCLFPTCVIRPHYGLSRGRPLYCSAHKKAGMVHLIKEASTRAMANKKRNAENSADAPPLVQRKRRRSGKGVGIQNETSEAEKSVGAGSEAEAAGGSEGRREAKAARRNPKGAAVKTSPAHSEKGSTLETSKQVNAGSNSEPLPATEESSGPSSPATKSSTGSHDKRMVGCQSAVLGATSRGGFSEKRARLPFLKALEASGVAQEEGAQWLTKEKSQVQARLKKGYGEQRNLAPAAGLGVSDAVETPVFTLAGQGASVDEGRRMDASAGANNVGPGRSNPSCRKSNLSSASHGVGEETLVVNACATTGTSLKRGSVPAAAAATSPKGEKKSKDRSTKRQQGAGKGEFTQGKTSDLVTAVPKASFRRRAFSKRNREGNCGKDQHMTPGRKIEGQQRERHGQTKGTTAEARGGGGQGKRKILCEFQSCSQIATFGVNGAVRYCTIHRLFGMHEIA